MKRKSWELKLIFLVLVAVFAVFLAVPAIRLLLKSFLGEDGLTGAYYLDVFSGKGFTTALGNSFAVSIVSALVAVGIAFVMAYIIHYTRLPRGFKRFVQAVATLPMFLPTITYGFAIIYSFGKQGLITRLLGHQFFDIYGFGGLLVGYVIYTVPVAFLLIHNTMGYVDKKTLVVSKAMGDGTLSTFWIAILRPLLGTLAGAFIQAFFLCFTDFGIPASVGGDYEVIATVLYNEMLGGVPDFNRGAVISVVMLLPSIVSILLLRFLERYNIRYDRISDADLRRNPGRDTAWLLMQALVSEYGEEEAQNILHDIYVNAGDHVESSGSAPLQLCEAGEVAVGFGLRHQAVAAKNDGLPIDYVDPTEGNFSLTESVAVLDKGDATNPLAMEMAQCIIENGRAELQQNYPNPLYEGESADNANKSAYPKTFSEPLTFELYEHHIEISEAAKP